MRFPLRRRASANDAGERREARKAAVRQPPASVLTRWLRQGLEAGMCPLCRVAHKADREYIWHFFDEGDRDAESIDKLRASCGFCGEHIEMLRRVEVDEMKSSLGITTAFAETLAGVADALETLSPDDPFRRAHCPACVTRDEVVEKNAGYLLDELATAPGRRARFESSPGLCFGHFELTRADDVSRSPPKIRR